MPLKRLSPVDLPPVSLKKKHKVLEALIDEKDDGIIFITGLSIGISGLRKSRTKQFKSILV